MNNSMQDNSFSMRNTTLKSRDKAHGHLPQIPMTPTEDQKRSSKNQDRYKNANNDQYLASGGSTIDQIRAQSHQKMKLLYKKQINSHRATSQSTSINAQMQQQPVERRNPHADSSTTGSASLSSVVAHSREHSNGPAT